MNRSDRHKKYRITKRVGQLIIVGVLAFVAYKGVSYILVPSSGPISTPVEEDLGRRVIVELPNGHELTTYEAYLYYDENGNLLYESKFHEMDLTGGKIKYSEDDFDD